MKNKKQSNIFYVYPEGRDELVKYLKRYQLGTVWYGNSGEKGFNNGSALLPKTMVALIYDPSSSCVCCKRYFYGNPMDKILNIRGDFNSDWTNSPLPEELKFLQIPRDMEGFHFHHPIYWWNFD